MKMKTFSSTVFTIFSSFSIAIASSARLGSHHNPHAHESTRQAPQNVNRPGGICTRNSDCRAFLRYQQPMEQDVIGPNLCDCYGSSVSLYPFDECQGKLCEGWAVCQDNNCAGNEAYCLRATNGMPGGQCAIRPIQINVDKPGGTCSSDWDCQAALRTQTPSDTEIVGSDAYECYGASEQLPFDECQGEEECALSQAGCAEDISLRLMEQESVLSVTFKPT